LLSGREGANGIVPSFALAMATLIVGIGIGLAFNYFAAGPSGGGNGVIAQRDLARALDVQLAGDETKRGPRVGVSFRSKAGALCRTFEMGVTAENVAGIACRNAGGWTINTLARAEPRSGAPYEVAGSAMPEAVRHALSEIIDGEPLDGPQERRARDDGWRARR
jgi:hypothetical protein